MPDGWDFKYNLTYNNILKIIEKMSQLDLRNSILVKAVAALTNNHDFITSIRKSCTSQVNLPVPELKNDDNIKESTSCPHSSLSLGPYSDNIGFGINDISNYKSFCGQKYFQFTNGSILEIRSISLGQQALYMGPFFCIVSDFYR